MANPWPPAFPHSDSFISTIEQFNDFYNSGDDTAAGDIFFKETLMAQNNAAPAYNTGSAPLPEDGFVLTRDRHQLLVEFLSKLLEFHSKNEYAAFHGQMTAYNPFFFLDRFIPPPVNGQIWNDYRNQLESVFLKQSRDFSSLYPSVTIANTGFSLAPVKTDIHRFLNPLTFLEQTASLASPGLYKAFYDQHYRFLEGSIQPLSKNALSLFVEGSKIPKAVIPNTPEDIALLYRKAIHNQIDVNHGIPTPAEVSSTGVSLLPRALTALNNSLTPGYHETTRAAESAPAPWRLNSALPPRRRDPGESADPYHNMEKSFHASFVQNPFMPGIQVPPFIVRHDNSLDVMSGYRYSYSKDSGHTVVLTRETPSGEKALPVSASLYTGIINNSTRTAGQPELTAEGKEKCLAMSNLDKDSLRNNTAANFWHNYRILCREEATNSREAMRIAKSIVNEMSAEERIKFKSVVETYEKASRPAGKPSAKPLETYNDRILKFYEDHVKDLPIQNTSVSDVKAFPSVVRNTVVHTKNGDPLSPLTRLKIGDPVRLTITEPGLFTGKKIPITKELVLVAHSDDVNKVVLLDRDKLSKYTFTKDEFVKTVQNIEKQRDKLDRREQKKYKSLRKAETIGY
jgi:hypothetical protein